MTKIAALLGRDLSRRIEEVVNVNNDDPATVFTELTEYIATDHIRAEYERLFSAMGEATKTPDEGVGIWISGFFGSGKTAFARNLGYVLANRRVNGASASSFFLKQLESRRIGDCVEYLNRVAPYEVFAFEVPEDPPVLTNDEPISEWMYRVLLRHLGYAEDYDIAELEIELEREGKLTAFEDLCRAEYGEEWRTVRNGSQRLARASALLNRLGLETYAAIDTWLNVIKARPSKKLTVEQFVERSFDLCEVRCHGKAFAFIIDEMGQYTRLGAEHLEILRAVVEQFGKVSLERQKAARIPGPAWIICTAQEKLPKLESFKYRIDLSHAGISEVAARRVLHKKKSEEPILRKLFRDRGASLIQHVKLERCSRRTEFDEDQFVQSYPYLPHLIDLSVEILAGIRLHRYSLKRFSDGNSTIVKQCFAMLTSKRTGLGDQPVGILVSIDKIYELVEENIPRKKQKDILDICQRFDGDKDFPGMAGRLAKAICLMEFVQTDLPRTTRNIAALLVQRVTEAPATPVVAAVLYRLREAGLVRETEDGWQLCDYDELRRATTSLDRLGGAVGLANPRRPGWHNELIQFAKRLVIRLLAWYTRPLQEFNASVRLSLEEIVSALDHLSMNMADQFSASTVTLDHLSMNSVALEARLAELEKRTATLREFVQGQVELIHQQMDAVASLQKAASPKAPVDKIGTPCEKRARNSSPSNINMDAENDKTAYIIGLFGTGRRYINELMAQNIGERAKYFRDAIRLHPGPTPMIYSGHATIRHVSRAQELPVVMSRILESVRSGFANVIFVYRHPLDSLLTNWVWWRTYIRDNRAVSGISQVYKNRNGLCADLEQNFSEFKAFVEGDPEFFEAIPGARFLSFAEFVEETELHLRSATLSLRLEDFASDPSKEFSKIAELMRVEVNLSRLSVAAPITKPYGYLAIQEKVPRFKDFIDGLDLLTKRRIENIGYSVQL